MSKRFFISDTHFRDFRELEVLGEKVHLFLRPFKSVEEQDSLLIENWNRLISPEDEVWHLGDFTTEKEGLEIRKQLNGKIHLIRGNKEDDFSDELLLEYFDSVQESKELVLANGEKVNLVHYPILGKKDLFNFVGHIHKAWTIQPNMINLGVDVWNWQPVREVELIHLMKAIREYYDRDCFAAYEENNQSHLSELKKLHMSYLDKLKF